MREGPHVSARGRISVPQIRRYGLRDSLGIAQNIVIPETQEAIAVCFNYRSTGCICLGRMLAAVGFDHEFYPMACEISEILADRGPVDGNGPRERPGEECARAFSPLRLDCALTCAPFVCCRVVGASSWPEPSGEITPTQPSPIKGRAI